MTTRGALAGLQVVELGGGVSAPYCAKLLADLGADVVKIEPPRLGDPARRAGPFPRSGPHPERSALFLYLNTSKRGITLDLEQEAGRDLFRRLVAARASVVVENLPPGTLERLGLGYSALRSLVPDLVLTSVTPFGESGPDRHRRCEHLNIYHAGGQSAYWSQPEGEERPPPLGPGFLGEVDGGLTAAVATLAAVVGRRLHGGGRHVDVSNQEALMCLERVDVGSLANAPAPPRPRMVGGLMEAKDGYVMSTAVQEHQWQGLVRAMGSPAWASTEICADEDARLEHRDEIQPHLDAWMAERTRDEIYHACQAEGVPMAPVRNVAEVTRWPQARAREFFHGVEHPEAGLLEMPSAPYRLSATPWQGRRAPLLGEHNAEIFVDELGISADELDELERDGVI